MKIDDLDCPSIALNSTTLLIDLREQDRAWRMFHRSYRLRDKSEIERRIKAIRKTQPVYNYLYWPHR